MFHGSLASLSTALLLPWLPTPVHGQRPTSQDWVDWDRWPATTSRMCFDPFSARLQVFNETQWLQWNGTAFWPRHAPLQNTHYGRSFAVDHASGWVFTYAVNTSTGQAGVWAFDGTTWRSMPMPPVSSPVFARELVHDPVRGQLALVGMIGWNNIAIWHWTGNAWSAPIASTTSHQYGSLAVAADEQRQRVVVASLQHQEWDGVQWQHIGAAPSITALTYDPVRHRLVGIYAVNTPMLIYEYDGTSWSMSTPPNGPPSGHACIGYDPALGEVLVVANKYPREGAQPWSWNGARLQQRGSSASYPGIGAPILDPVRSRMLALAEDQLLTWEGDHWQVIGTGPQPRFLTFDAQGQRIVGMLSHSLLELRAGNWVQFAVLPNYLYQISHGVFEFDAGGTLLIHGPPLLGSTTVSLLYRSATGFQLPPPGPQPTAFADFSARYHPASGGIVLFGGQANGQDLDETWLFAASVWSQLSPLHSPPARRTAALTLDPVTGELVLAGGYFGSQWTPLLDTWSWNGVDWRQLPGTLPRATSSAAFEPLRGVVAVTAGRTLAFYSQHLPLNQTHGLGCGGSRGTPTLKALGDASIGNDTLALRVGNVNPGTLGFVMFDFATNPAAPGPCSVYLPQPITLSVLPADVYGGCTTPIPIPFLPSVRGLAIHLQGGAIDFAPGALYGEYSLTAALQLTISD
jgi:hypothetical protein